MFLSGPILVMKAQSDLLNVSAQGADEPDNEGAWVLTFLLAISFAILCGFMISLFN